MRAGNYSSYRIVIQSPLSRSASLLMSLDYKGFKEKIRNSANGFLGTPHLFFQSSIILHLHFINKFYPQGSILIN